MRNNKQTALEQLRKIVFAFCKGLDTPRSLKLWILVRENEWEQVARFKVHPTEYLDADTFAVDYAVSNFLRKTSGLPAVADTKAAAVSLFAKTEEQCRETNLRIRAYLDGRVKPLNPLVEQVIHLAQLKLGQLVGSFDPSLVAGQCSWGNGATSDLSRSRAYVDTKLTKLPFSCTPSAWKHAAAIIRADLHWTAAIIEANKSSCDIPVITGEVANVFDTVPKTVLTDRCIAKEPRLNGFLQKGVGKFIRSRLRRVGVDLQDQGHNQTLASFSRRLGLATLDLESASDTIAFEAVRLLTPEPLFEYMDDIRSRYTRINGIDVKLEKFSSMGNAFTFELESAIYWALASAASDIQKRSTIGIFGDDIIVHKDVAPLLTDTLSFMGFSLNKEKSFTEGEFFESCGKHYFGDTDVTPIYQKCVPATTFDRVRLCNRLLRFATRLGGHLTLDKRVGPAWHAALREYDLKDLTGPIVGDRDDYVESPKGYFTGSYSPNYGYRVKTISEEPKWIPADDSALYAIWLRNSWRRVHDADNLQHLMNKTFRMFGLPRHLRALTERNENSALLVLFPDSSSSPMCKHGGVVESRVDVRVVNQNRWVQPTASSVLNW